MFLCYQLKKLYNENTGNYFEKQTVRIDNHKSGTREEIKWGKGFHIHKIMNDKRYKGAEFTLPLDHEGTIKMD